MTSILLYSSHILIPEIFISEVNIWRSLRQNQNYKLIYLGCRGGLSSACTTHVYLGASQRDQKAIRKICNKCISSQEAFADSFDIEHQYIDDYLTKDDVARIDELLGTDNIDELLKLEIYGIPVGRIATYDPCINLQLHSAESLKTSGSTFYRESLRACLVCLYSIKGFLKTNHIDVAFIWNSMYSSNRVVKDCVEFHSGVVYNLNSWTNFSNQLSRVECHQGLPTEFQSRRKQQFASHASSLPITQRGLADTRLHIKSILDSRLVFTYSQKLDARLDPSQIYNIPTTKKVVLACLSSNDERLAAQISGASPEQTQDSLFPSQADWISWLIATFQNNTDITLVVRPHPRDFPNRRSKALSPFGKKLQSLLKHVGSSVIVDWPENRVPIYCWSPITSLVLYSWSSVAKEFALLGVPTLSYDTSLLTYPDDITYTASSLAGYESSILRCAELRFNLDHYLNVIRWYQYEHRLTTLALPAPLPNTYTPEGGLKSVFEVFKTRLYRKLNILLPIYARKLKRVKSNKAEQYISTGIDLRLADLSYETSIISTMEVASTDDCLKLLKELIGLLPSTKHKCARYTSLQERLND